MKPCVSQIWRHTSEVVSPFELEIFCLLPIMLLHLRTQKEYISPLPSNFHPLISRYFLHHLKITPTLSTYKFWGEVNSLPPPTSIHFSLLRKKERKHTSKGSSHCGPPSASASPRPWAHEHSVCPGGPGMGNWNPPVWVSLRGHCTGSSPEKERRLSNDFNSTIFTGGFSTMYYTLLFLIILVSYSVFSFCWDLILLVAVSKDALSPYSSKQIWA